MSSFSIEIHPPGEACNCDFESLDPDLKPLLDAITRMDRVANFEGVYRKKYSKDLELVLRAACGFMHAIESGALRKISIQDKTTDGG